MALSVTHPYVSAVADSGDTSIVQPSDWNAAHTLAGLGTGVEAALEVALGSTGAVLTNNAPASIAAGTLTTDVKTLDLSATWNNAAVTFTGIKFNATSTASAAASLLMDLQVGGASKAKIMKDGSLYINTTATTALAGQGVSAGSGASLHVGAINGSCFLGRTDIFGGSAVINDLKLAVKSDMPIGWSSDSTSYGTQDVILRRDAANTLALRNGTNAQKLNWYYSYTDSSNYVRGALATSASAITISAETAGTGADNIDVSLIPAGTGKVTLPGGTLLKTSAALTDGAAAQAGTLLNAPAAGNPTKWIPIDDNGTTRYIPAW